MNTGVHSYFFDSEITHQFMIFLPQPLKTAPVYQYPLISRYAVHRVLSRVLPAETVQTCVEVMRRGREIAGVNKPSRAR